MRDGGTPRRAAAGRGVKDRTEDGPTVARPTAAVVPIREDLIRELALVDDWRARVTALKLSDTESRALAIEIIRARVFNATAVGTARARARAQGRR